MSENIKICTVDGCGKEAKHEVIDYVMVLESGIADYVNPSVNHFCDAHNRDPDLNRHDPDFTASDFRAVVESRGA